MKLLIQKIKDTAVLPTRAHHDDAGIDLYACGDCEVAPHATVRVATGIAMKIDEWHVGLIWDKSSIGAKGIKTLGGVVDAGYRGEVQVIVHNLNDAMYTFSHGDKVAQMLIQKVELCEVEEVTELSDTSRGEGGFGSTGR